MDSEVPFAQAPARWRGFLLWKWLTITDSADGWIRAPAMTVSMAGCTFWLVVVGMSLCRDTAVCGAKQV